MPATSRKQSNTHPLEKRGDCDNMYVLKFNTVDKYFTEDKQASKYRTFATETKLCNLKTIIPLENPSKDYSFGTKIATMPRSAFGFL